MTTVTTAPIGSLQTWVRPILLTAGLALLLASPVQPVGAEEKHDAAQAAWTQIAFCEAMGGTATVEDYRTPGDGLVQTVVTCKFPWGGWHCVNDQYGSTCFPNASVVSPHKWSNDWTTADVLEVLETGSVTQINALLADLDVGNLQTLQATKSAVSPAEQHQDQHPKHSKHQKGKHGKHGGEHRKR